MLIFSPKIYAIRQIFAMCSLSVEDIPQNCCYGEILINLTKELKCRRKTAENTCF